jgi:hypothetical protein
MNEDVFQLLTRDCGWSVEQFRTWAVKFMLHQLIAGGATRTSTQAGRAYRTGSPERRP